MTTALVYRGPATLPGCSEAVASLLVEGPWGLDVHYVGPGEDRGLEAATLAGAALYVQPGGGTLRAGWRRMKRHRRDVREFVAGGGRYVGFCLGAYLAGATPGFDLLPGDTDQYAGSSGATLHGTDDAVVEVTWRGAPRRLYAQDPATFELDPTADVDADADDRAEASGLGVLARYSNGAPAALVAAYGAGRVGVVGPHPEATGDWFDDVGLPRPDGPDGGLARDLGRDLVDTVLRGGARLRAR